MKRVFDIVFAFVVITLLSPVFIIIPFLIVLDSKGGVFYFQKRVGKNFREFSIIKFRTMKAGSEKSGLLTVGQRDIRITRVGYILRKFKIDELPQFFNVLKGDMSVVGPRPEVKKYVQLYNEEQRKVLTVKPGITDFASVKFSDENRILAQYADAEEAYIKEIMPMKLELGLEYIREMSFGTDLRIILQTLRKVFFS
jgi:lipopolysaccharide/colanic/teichoic acid biosynthesis glycosyltransferase